MRESLKKNNQSQLSKAVNAKMKEDKKKMSKLTDALAKKDAIVRFITIVIYVKRVIKALLKAIDMIATKTPVYVKFALLLVALYKVFIEDIDLEIDILDIIKMFGK